jgi:LPXTG-site transpeptidase (sortase) family protein
VSGGGLNFGGCVPRRPPKSLRWLAASLGLATVGLALGVAAAISSDWSRTTYLQRHPQTVRALARNAQFVPVRFHPRLERQMPVPSRLLIPAIGVRAPLVPLGRNRDGSVEVPAGFSVAGWFRPGPEPGERGAAVILGHVDSRSGPGVFYRLEALRRGDVIRVRLVTRETVTFVVTGSTEVSKRRFPTKLVYAHTRKPTLRLVTCGGAFDSATGHYLNNYVVFARVAP